MPADPPIACTLAPTELKQRLAELNSLTQETLLSARRNDLTPHLQYPLSTEPRLRHMVAREQQCCAFLHFSLTRRTDRLHLRIDAPEAARQGIEEIYQQFLPQNS